MARFMSQGREAGFFFGSESVGARGRGEERARARERAERETWHKGERCLCAEMRFPEREKERRKAHIPACASDKPRPHQFSHTPLGKTRLMIAQCPTALARCPRSNTPILPFLSTPTPFCPLTPVMNSSTLISYRGHRCSLLASLRKKSASTG